MFLITATLQAWVREKKAEIKTAHYDLDLQVFCTSNKGVPKGTQNTQWAGVTIWDGKAWAQEQGRLPVGAPGFLSLKSLPQLAQTAALQSTFCAVGGNRPAQRSSNVKALQRWFSDHLCNYAFTPLTQPFSLATGEDVAPF